MTIPFDVRLTFELKAKDIGVMSSNVYYDCFVVRNIGSEVCTYSKMYVCCSDLLILCTKHALTHERVRNTHTHTSKFWLVNVNVLILKCFQTIFSQNSTYRHDGTQHLDV